MSQPGSDRIELGALRAALAERTRTPLGKDRALGLGSLAKIEDARERIEAVRQARMVIDRGDEPPFGAATDVRPPLDLAEKGGVLDGPQLREIAETMHASSALHRFLLAREDEAVLLYGIGAAMHDLSREADEIRRCFTRDGQLADDASPELGPLRKRLRSLHEMIREKLEELLQSASMKTYLQEPYFTLRADRYVLPIKASFQGDVPGIVHDASGSGHTVFIEPQAVVDLGNRLKIAQSAVLEEEQRILGELTLEVVRVADSIRANLIGVGMMDLLSAGARLSTDLDAEPILPDADPGFDLISARHPLLVLQRLGTRGDPVVPNDLGLKDGQCVLILTGPNTGGKTVAMKTVGMFAEMVRCGLHLPCSARSRIGWYARIEAAIGDDQSIASNLSTFAAHLRQIMRLYDAAVPGALVLLDEIAADTDPTQGQALAQAVLESLADRGAHVVVTTHFERLKAVPFADSRFRNAGVGFDPDRLRPTYKVTLDVPQSSSGIDIAQSLGLPREIVARARALIGEGSIAIEALMRGLRDKQAELERARAQTEEATHRLVVARNELEEKKADLERERQRLIEHARTELVEEIKGTRTEVRGIIAKLQKVASSDAVREAMRLATEAAAQLAHTEAVEAAKLPPTESQGSADEPLAQVAVGDWVHVGKLEKDGEVVAIEGKEALVAVGNMRTRIPLSSVFAARTKRPKGTLSTSKHLKRALEDAREKPKAEFAPTEEMDLRGQTVDEALTRIDGFLDVHYSGPASRVKIIHGYGSGALKQAIREHLRRSGYVRTFRPGDDSEGGDGVTIVELA